MIQNLWDTKQQYNLTSGNKQTKSNLTPEATIERTTKPKASKREKKIRKIKVKLNEINMKKTIAKINEMKIRFFEKIKKNIIKLLARLIKKGENSIQ